MEFPVLLEPSNISKLRIKVDGLEYSPSDVPKTVIFDPNINCVKFLYTINEPEKDITELTFNDCKIMYSDQTGRIYNINCESEWKSSVLQNHLKDLINNSVSSRINDNLKLGIKVISNIRSNFIRKSSRLRDIKNSLKEAL